MPKPPLDFLVDDFIYAEYIGENKYSEPQYAAPVIIKRCRIDRGSQYTSTTSGKQLLFNGLVICYEGMTTPLIEFKAQSRISYDGKDHIITKVIPVYEAYDAVIYSYELEVV